MKTGILFTLALAFNVGCVTGNCRSVKEAQKTPEQIQREALAPANTNSKTRILVYKYDGTLQCGMGKQIGLDEMKAQLKGVNIFSAENKSDNLMHVQACGTPTGRANVFEIDNSQIETAKKAGFQEWTFD